MPPRLVVEVIGDTSRFEKSLSRASSSANSFGGSLGKLSVSLGQLVKGVVVVDGVQKALEGLRETAHLGIDEFVQQAKVAAQTTAVLKSTGGAANISAKQVDDLALSLSNLSGMTKPALQAAENALLAFTNVRDFAGAGNNIFSRATHDAIDFAARTGRDATQAALVFGKALQDPATRVGSLARAGVVLTKSQRDAVVALQRTSGVVAAQKLLLKDLEERYKGAAAAAGNTVPGELNKLRNALAEIGGDVIGKNVDGFQSLLAVGVKWAQNADNQKRVADDLQRALHDVGEAAHDLRAVFDAVEPKVKAVSDALGGAKTSLELLGGAVVALKITKLLDAFAGIAGGARTASGEVSVLQSRLLALRTLGTIGITIAVGFEIAKGAQAFSKFLGGTGFGKAIGAGDTPIPGGLSFDDVERIAKAVKTHQLKAGDLLKAKLLGYSSAQIAAAAIQKALTGPAGKPQKTATPLPSGLTGPTSVLPPAPGGPGKGLTATQRNSFFDATIDRDLGRVQDITSIQGQIGRLQQIADLITKRLAATKDITRRLNLEDKLLDVFREIKGDRQQLAQNFVDSLELGVTKAQATGNVKKSLDALAALKAGIQAQIAATGDSADLESRLFDVMQRIKDAHAQVFQNRIDLAEFRVTKAEATLGFGDDLKALTDLQNKIKAQIKATGSTLDLQEQLFGAQQRLKAAKLSALDAKQFKFLGLGPTGEALAPSVGALQKSLGKISDAVAGTFLDTKANRSLFAKIRTELSGNMKVLSDEVRNAIKSMLDDLQAQLDKSGGEVTKFKHLSSAAFAKSIPGLTAAQRRAVEAQFSVVGAGGTAPSGRSPAFATPARSAGVTITGPVHLYGITDVKAMEAELVRLGGRRAARKRGHI